MHLPCTVQEPGPPYLVSKQEGDRARICNVVCTAVSDH